MQISFNSKILAYSFFLCLTHIFIHTVFFVSFARFLTNIIIVLFFALHFRTVCLSICLSVSLLFLSFKMSFFCSVLVAKLALIIVNVSLQLRRQTNFKRRAQDKMPFINTISSFEGTWSLPMCCSCNWMVLLINYFIVFVQV